MMTHENISLPTNGEEHTLLIPVEKIVDGEVVVVDTKAIPIIPQKE